MRRSKGLLGLCAALMLAAAPAIAAGSGAPAKATQCFACHGEDGLSKAPDAPNLAGQNEQYLVKALQDFRSGARAHEVMSMMAKGLSDQDIQAVSAYFSAIAISVKAP